MNSTSILRLQQKAEMVSDYGGFCGAKMMHDSMEMRVDRCVID